jgi:hypothetical protein
MTVFPVWSEPRLEGEEGREGPAWETSARTDRGPWSGGPWERLAGAPIPGSADDYLATRNTFRDLWLRRSHRGGSGGGRGQTAPGGTRGRPALTRAWPRTDVWVYPFSPEETETRAQREQATSRTASSTAKPGLRGWHKAAILAVCGVLVLAGSLLVLDATGNLSAFLPEDRGGSVHGAGQPSRVEASFRDKYEEELRSQPEGARTKEVRCLIAGEDAYRCVAYTEAMGSGTYPDDFELAVDARGCWRAQPLAPNLIDATIAECS